jgi:hypothetical protein
MIEVKVMEVPGTVRDVALEDGAKVSDALAQAQMEVRSGYTLKVDGAEATTDTVLSNGARVIIAKGAKGNG